MNKEQLLNKHKKMWEWISNHPTKTKTDYLDMIGEYEDIPYDCYLCRYSNVHCSQCLVKWDIRDPITDFKYSSVCYDDRGLFNLYTIAFDNHDFREASRLASLISKIKEKE